MQMHVVLYKAYPKNPKAAEMIISKAKELLSKIVLGSTFNAGWIINTGRAVGNNEYDIMLQLTFVWAADYHTYMSHPQHMDFVRFVLRGYMLKGSQAKDPEAEFIEYILRGDAPREWERNPTIPDSEVVWGGELVFDACC